MTAPPGPPSRRILVVEDSVFTARSLESLLNQAGYAVRRAGTGEEAVDLLGQELPDLVLCDVTLPRMSGLKVVEHLRQIRAQPRIPVIMLSSKSESSDKVEGLEAGADDYVTKPFSSEELLARVRSHLRARMLQEEILSVNSELRRTQDRLQEKMRQLRRALQEISQSRKASLKNLDLAGRVQRGFLLESPPAIPGHAVAFAFWPAQHVAGDFYDVIELPRDRWGVAVGDVAGKGVPASLLMVLARTLLRTEALGGGSPAAVLARLNRALAEDYRTADPITMFYGVLDIRDGTFTWSNGGHEYPLLIPAGCPGDPVPLTAGGPFLGIFPGAVYREGRLDLLPGDRVTLFSDGVYHLSWRKQELGRPERIGEFLCCHPEKGLHDRLRGVRVPRGRLVDDVTILELLCQKSRGRPRTFELETSGGERSLKDVLPPAAALLAGQGVSPGRQAQVMTGLTEALLATDPATPLRVAISIVTRKITLTVRGGRKVPRRTLSVVVS